MTAGEMQAMWLSHSADHIHTVGVGRRGDDQHEWQSTLDPSQDPQRDMRTNRILSNRLHHRHQAHSGTDQLKDLGLLTGDQANILYQRLHSCESKADKWEAAYSDFDSDKWTLTWWLYQLDRMVILNLEIEDLLLIVVREYIPQVGCQLEEKDDFWIKPKEVVKGIPGG